MVNWTDPHTLFLQTASLQRVTLIFSGIYFYEFILSLPYDWEVLKRIRGRPTALVGNTLYLVCRYLALMNAICSCVLTSGNTTISCQALLRAYSFSAVIGIACASSLLFVRAGIIWRWNTWIVALLSPFLVAIFATGIRTVVLFSSTFDPNIGQCTLNSAIQDRAISISVFCGDLTLLTFILIGLQRGWGGTYKFPLWSILWNQGLLYFVLAVMVEVPLMVFLLLNLNEIMNAIFVVPAGKFSRSNIATIAHPEPIAVPLVVMMAIGSTRFHRDLTQYTSGRIAWTMRMPVHRTKLLERDTFELGEISPAPVPGMNEASGRIVIIS
ncbi:unnamed protein product [Peniophora sp. CBMAI 1063]|nr:unnamed protein product [Peniophora sp. CBMAI 1063]